MANEIADVSTDDLMKGRPRIALPDNTDVATAAVGLLYDLNLLPSKQDLADAGDFGAAFGGPPASVSVVESGATALAKWWAVAGTVIATGTWAAVAGFWNKEENKPIHNVILWCAAILSASIVLGIAYLLASDVRGRAAATVETISARRDIAKAVIEAGLQRAKAAAEELGEVVPIPKMEVKNTDGGDSPGWHAIAMQVNSDASKVKYLIVKGGDKVWLDSQYVTFT